MNEIVFCNFKNNSRAKQALLLIILLVIFGIREYSISAIKLFKFPTFPDTIEQYQPIFTCLQIKSQLINPFDNTEIKVDLLVTTPSNEKIIQPGFYDGAQDEVSSWGVRFTPLETGKYSFQFMIENQRDTIISKTFSVHVIPSERNGFLRLNPQSDYTLKYDAGKLFRGFGENVCWSDNFEHYFKKLNAVGCNFVRIWMCPWNLYLEWAEPGLGKYNLQNAAQLDSVLSLAEKYDIYIMLCFDYHGVVQKQQGYFHENKWNENPYNQKNGGPCKTQSDFFSSPIAKKCYKNRLNYIVARYAFSPHIFAWEFWNEVDLTAGKLEDIITWHREMAAYLREIDPYKHLITTSFSSMEIPEIWQINEIDITQTHLYNKPNYAEFIPETIARHILKYQKPHVIGEFGSDYRGSKETRENDPQNAAIHNGLWAGLFSPTPISPLSWWWDELIETDNLYFHFQAITNFARDILFSSKPIQQLDIEDVFIGNNSSNSINSHTIYPTKSWGINKISSFQITADGQVANNNDQIPSYLYGKTKSEMKEPPEFKINYQSDGRFFVHVDEVSDFGLLKIYLDGKLALEKPLPLGKGKGEWEKSGWKEEINLFQGVYNKSYGIDVPAGDHTIRIENDGRDWIKIAAYKFEDSSIMINKNKIKVTAVCQNPNIFLWFRNENYQWQLTKNEKIQELPETTTVLQIPALAVGNYQVEWWDAYEGKIFQTSVVSVIQENKIKIIIPSFNRDIACKIFRKIKNDNN